MPRLVPARRDDPEWMDRADNPPAVLERALVDLRAVNRLLGGERNLLELLRPYWSPRGASAPLRVLDVGTGGADLPRAIVAEARRRGVPVAVVGVDRDPTTAAFARRAVADFPEIEIAEADVAELPWPPRSFDVVVASLFLHHFTLERGAELLRRWRALARRAVLVNDLQRHAIPWLFIRFAGWATRRQAMFRHDAPLSVLRGFTAAELRDLAARAGAPGAEVRRRWPYRLGLVLPAADARVEARG